MVVFKVCVVVVVGISKVKGGLNVGFYFVFEDLGLWKFGGSIKDLSLV